ncbi:MAG TPA: helix-turn-helix transcriptional regulator [Terriglobia bacterium]|nr:helix-turn-helix transcriptional regulator [Terriglobia bacterium]
MSIGTRIIQIRNQKNMTQRQLSERTGIAGSYLSRIENRRLEAGPKTLRKIAEALGVPLGELFQESPTAHSLSQCVITASGNCIMEMLENRQRKGAHAGTESYSPRQLKLLRMANYLIQSGNSRILDTLDLLLSALISSEETQQARTFPALLSPKPQSSPQRT